MRILESITVLAAVALLAAPARGDRRNFPFTYEATTLAKGEMEIEQYLTARGMRLGPNDSVLEWVYQLEFEYGVFDRLDVSLYQMFGQRPNESLSWLGWKAKARYRPVDYGRWPVDPLLYFEVIQLADGTLGLEEKLVFGRRGRHYTAALNLTLEEMGLNRTAREIEFAPSLAAAWTPRPWLSIGAEALTVTSWEFGSGRSERTGPAWYVGPVIAMAGSRAWFAISNLWQLGEVAKDKFRVRLLVGIFL